MLKWLLVVLPLFSRIALAEPYVIFDSGMGVSTDPYKGLFNTLNTQNIGDSWIFKEIPEQDKDTDQDKAVKNLYPITTTKLMPKKIDQPLEKYFPRMPFPICIVGDDEISVSWLERNRHHLGQTGAQCFVVSAHSAETAAPLNKLLTGIPSYPANGDAIAEHFGIKYYPVLITDRYATQ
jgi:integrating conjugative element protein (TIGR03765 family)